MEILRILGEPNDPKYSDVIKWLPPDFHPSRFDILTTSNELYDAYGEFVDRRRRGR